MLGLKACATTPGLRVVLNCISVMTKDVDHEATFAKCDAARAKETFHSTARQAAEIAYKAQVKRLVIGHYSARYEDMAPLKKEADKIFPGTILGEEGMRLSV